MEPTLWQNVFIQALYLKIKAQLFYACLIWTLLIWSTCTAAYSFPTVCNWKGTYCKRKVFLIQTFKLVSYSSSLTPKTRNYYKCMFIWYTVYLISLWKIKLYFHSVANKLNFISVLKKIRELLSPRLFEIFPKFSTYQNYGGALAPLAPASLPSLTSDDRLIRRWCVPFNSWVV